MPSDIITLHSIEVQRLIHVVVTASKIKRRMDSNLDVAIGRAEFSLAKAWSKMYHNGEKTREEWYLREVEFQNNPRIAYTAETLSVERVWLEAKEAKVAAVNALVVAILSGVLSASP